MEKVTTYEDLHDFCRVGSPFSIPKAALCLAGFSPQFGSQAQATLVDQLRAFGCGIEVTLLSAIPAGSGLGTSSLDLLDRGLQVHVVVDACTSRR